MSAEVSYLDIDAANRRVERMRHHATAMHDSAQSLLKTMHQARELEDHLTLGYASWPALLVDVFGAEPLRLSREVRREVVAEMSDAGMSVRAIAPLVGVSKDTVQRDITGVSNETPGPAESLAPIPVTFQVDGMTVTSRGEVIDSQPEVTEHTFTEKVKTVTGLDGKSYPKPEPAAPRRKSLVDDAYKANTDLFLVIERIRALTADDRFTRNKADILAALQPSADLAIEILTDLANTN